MTSSVSTEVKISDVAEVLCAMADLMSSFRQNDLALQDSLSSIAARARTTPEMGNLQHVDLITQTHGDLAKLLPKLASILEGTELKKEALKKSLSLRSLQDTLIEQTNDQSTQPGELSLF